MRFWLTKIAPYIIKLVMTDEAHGPRAVMGHDLTPDGESCELHRCTCFPGHALLHRIIKC